MPRKAILTLAMLLTAAWSMAGVPYSASAAITVDTSSASTDVSPLLYGSQFPWTRYGSGALQSHDGLLTEPVTYSSFLIQKATEMKLSTVRFHGDNVYHFRDGIGPLEQRPGRKFSFYGDQVWSNEFGTDEFIALCRKLGAEPVMVAPYLSDRTALPGSPLGDQLCANWVEYCNGVSPGLDYGVSHGWQPTRWTNPGAGVQAWRSGAAYQYGDTVRATRAHAGVFRCIRANTASDANSPGMTGDYTPYWTFLPSEEIAVDGKSWKCTDSAPAGYFAWLREFYGHKEPYGIKYWEIGNEIHAWDGRVPACPWATAASYRDNFVRIVDKMKAVDSTIQVGCVLPGPRPPGHPGYYPEHAGWMATVLGAPGSPTTTYNKADFLVWHVYVGQFTRQTPADYADVYGTIADYESVQRDFMANYPKPVMITECNVRAEYYSPRLWAGLAYAKMLSQFVRLGVLGTNQMYFCETSAWFQTGSWRAIFEDRYSNGQARSGVTPTYLAMKLYSLYGRGRRAAATVSGQQNLDAVAVLNKTDGHLHLFVINQSPTANEAAQIDVGSFKPGNTASVYTLNSAAGMEADNEQNQSNVTIASSTAAVPAAQFSYTFLAHSLTVLDIAPATAGDSPFASVDNSVEVTLSSNIAQGKPGDTVTYIVNCRSRSMGVVAASRVALDLPPGARYVQGSAQPAADYSPMHGRLVWTLTNLQPGETRTCQFNVIIR